MVKIARKGRIRLALDLPDDIYYAIQKGAITSYTTMTNYVLRAILDRFKLEGLLTKSGEVNINDSDRIIIPRQPRNKNKKYLTEPENK